MPKPDRVYLDGILVRITPTGLLITLTPGLRAQMAADHEISESVRGLLATLHQADYGVRQGKYKSIHAGVAALTGVNPLPIEEQSDTIH